MGRMEAHFEEKRKERERISAQYGDIGDIGDIGEKDGEFISGSKGIVLDTKTGLMWAAKDNGSSIQWKDASIYCRYLSGWRIF